jgi:hypothetical protein
VLAGLIFIAAIGISIFDYLNESLKSLTDFFRENQNNAESVQRKMKEQRKHQKSWTIKEVITDPFLWLPVVVASVCFLIAMGVMLVAMLYNNH